MSKALQIIHTNPPMLEVPSGTRLTISQIERLRHHYPGIVIPGFVPRKGRKKGVRKLLSEEARSRRNEKARVRSKARKSFLAGLG